MLYLAPFKKDLYYDVFPGFIAYDARALCLKCAALTRSMSCAGALPIDNFGHMIFSRVIKEIVYIVYFRLAL